MSKYDVTLLTERNFLDPEDRTDFVIDVLLEDQILQEELEKLGLKVFRTNWDNPDFDWKETKSVVFRSTWDYIQRLEEFNTALDKMAEDTIVINPRHLMKWNIDKHYLKFLEEEEIAIVPTEIIEIGDERTLAEIYEETKGREIILKPAIAASARHTYKVNRKNLAELEPVFRELIAVEAMLVQEFQKKVLTRGEISLMFYNGNFSHAILKQGKKDEFRVQREFGGGVKDHRASITEIEFASRVLEACDSMPVYARVDLLWSNRNQLLLSELELIEPEMWFRKSSKASKMMAEAVYDAITPKVEEASNERTRYTPRTDRRVGGDDERDDGTRTWNKRSAKTKEHPERSSWSDDRSVERKPRSRDDDRGDFSEKREEGQAEDRPKVSSKLRSKLLGLKMPEPEEGDSKRKKDRKAWIESKSDKKEGKVSFGDKKWERKESSRESSFKPRFKKDADDRNRSDDRPKTRETPARSKPVDFRTKEEAPVEKPVEKKVAAESKPVISKVKPEAEVSVEKVVSAPKVPETKSAEPIVEKPITEKKATVAKKPEMEATSESEPVAEKPVKAEPKKKVVKSDGSPKAISLKEKLEQMKAAKAEREAAGEETSGWKPKFK